MRQINQTDMASLLKLVNRNEKLFKKFTKKNLTPLNDQVKMLQRLVETKIKGPLDYQFLKAEQAKRILKVSTSTLISLRANGILPFYRVNGSIYYKYDEIMTAMENYRVVNHQ